MVFLSAHNSRLFFFLHNPNKISLPKSRIVPSCMRTNAYLTRTKFFFSFFLLMFNTHLWFYYTIVYSNACMWVFLSMPRFYTQLKTRQTHKHIDNWTLTATKTHRVACMYLFDSICSNRLWVYAYVCVHECVLVFECIIWNLEMNCDKNQ